MNTQFAGRVIIHFESDPKQTKQNLSEIYQFINSSVDWSKCPVKVIDVSRGYVTVDKPEPPTETSE